MHGDNRTQPQVPQVCSPIPNTYFETLDNPIPYIVNITLNVPLFIITTFANLLVLLAMRRVTSIRLPSKLLLCSLVLTDLGTGLAVQPQFSLVLYKKAASPFAISCSLVKAHHFGGSFFSSVSFFMLTAISLDRYAALFFHLKYQQTVTTRRVCAVLGFIWLFSLFYASATLWNFALWRAFAISGIVTNVFVMSVAYIRIYRRFRGNRLVQPKQSDDSAQQQPDNMPNTERHRKTASAMMWVYVVFLVCYSPYLCMSLVIQVTGVNPLTTTLHGFCYSIVFLNSCLNPLLYCLRLPGFRTEVMKQLSKFCCL